MRLYLILFFLMLCTTISSAQDVTVETFNFYDTLSLDLYFPPDKVENPPLLIFVHGGGFAGGSRDGGDVPGFCQALAKDGIMVASVSYRLQMQGRGFGCNIPAQEKVSVFHEAASDVARATSFLIKRKAELQFNPDKVILAGSSAGAETVLYLSYWDETIDPSGLSDDFRYAGVISFAGAIIDLRMINQDNAIPVMLVHGTCDNLVPYASAPHHYCSYDKAGYLPLHGSGSIAERYEELGGSFRLYTSCGGNHDWAGIPMREMTNEVSGFILDDVVNNKKRQLREWLPSDIDCSAECPN